MPASGGADRAGHHASLRISAQKLSRLSASGTSTWLLPAATVPVAAAGGLSPPPAPLPCRAAVSSPCMRDSRGLPGLLAAAAAPAEL